MDSKWTTPSYYREFQPHFDTPRPNGHWLPTPRLPNQFCEQAYGNGAQPHYFPPPRGRGQHQRFTFPGGNHINVYRNGAQSHRFPTRGHRFPFPGIQNHNTTVGGELGYANGYLPHQFPPRGHRFPFRGLPRGPGPGPHIFNGEQGPPYTSGHGHGSRFGFGDNVYSDTTTTARRPPPEKKPWLTPELLQLIYARNNAAKKAEMTRNPADFYTFKKLRQDCLKRLNAAKFDYEIEMGSKKTLFHCDPCDKSCIDQESLDAHNAEHMICKLDGCTFTAHPKIIVKHIQMQHSTDLYEKIAGYVTPEEIKMWINERKRNFPTKDNKERKQQEARERAERGETIRKKPKKLIPTYSLEKRRYTRVEEKNDELRRRRLGASQRRIAIPGNTSEVVILKSFYASVKRNSKGELIGSDHRIWKGNADFQKQKLKNEDSDKNESSDSASELNDVAYFTDEEHEGEPKTPPPPQLPDYDRALAPTSPVDFEISNNCGNLTKKPGNIEEENNAKVQNGSLLGLLAYISGSDSEMEDGEVRDEDGSAPNKITSSSEPIPLFPISNTYSLHTDELPTKTSLNKPIQSKKMAALKNRRKVASRARQRTRALRAKAILAEPAEVEAGQAEEKIKKCDGSPLPDPPEKLKSEPDESLEPKISLRKTVKKRKIIDTPRKSKKPIILKYLLGPQIRHERNILLQVCRFIGDNEFFEGEIPHINSDSEYSDSEMSDEPTKPKESSSPSPSTLETDTSKLDKLGAAVENTSEGLRSC